MKKWLENLKISRKIMTGFLFTIIIALIGAAIGTAGILNVRNKLTAALEKDPDSVISMLTNSGDSQKGLLYKMSDSVTSYLDKVKNSIKANDKAVSGTGGLDDKIEDMEDDLDDDAEKYYNKFSVMETALSKLNSQMSMLSSLFSS